MLKRKLCIAISIFLIAALSLSGCKKEKIEIPPLGEDKIREDIEGILKEEGYYFDNLSEFLSEKVEPSESDMVKLKQKYSEPVPYEKRNLKFILQSSEMEIEAEYSVIYVFLNTEWKLSFQYKENEAAWKETSKSGVSTKQIMDDLKNVEIEGFKKGFIGSGETTNIKIVNRNSDLKNKQDNIVFDVSVKTDFATFEFSSTAIYYFKKGKWEAAQIQPDHPAKWEITYFEDRKPEAPTSERVFDKLTDPDNTLTYISNRNFIKKSYISEPTERIGQNSVTFDYIYIVTYENIGDFQYLVSIPFEWIGGDWLSGEIKTEYIKSSLKPILGTWKAGEKRSIVFTKAKKDLLEGIYFMEVDGVQEEYKMKCKFNVLLKETDWEIIVDSVNIPDGTDSHFDLKVITVNLKDQVLVANNKQFQKEGAPSDLEDGESPLIEDAKNPKEEENAEEDSNAEEESTEDASSDENQEPSSEEIKKEENEESKEINIKDPKESESTESEQVKEKEEEPQPKPKKDKDKEKKSEDKEKSSEKEKKDSEKKPSEKSKEEVSGE